MRWLFLFSMVTHRHLLFLYFADCFKLTAQRNHLQIVESLMQLNQQTMKRLLLLPFLILNFSLAIAQNCNPPTDVMVNVTAQATTLTWTNPDSLMAEIFIQLEGGTAPDATTVPAWVAAGPPFNMEGLQCGMTYDVYVRSVCSDSQSTAWSGPVTFLYTPVDNFSLSPMIQGDADNDGIVIFDLTAIEAQLD